ncbi:MAG: pyruvate formate lyase family protein [Candidatus Brocadiia bacterium]
MATVIDRNQQLAAATRELRAEVRRDAAPYAERLLLVAQAFRETEGEPYRGRRTARATRRIFERMPLKIRRGELLLGWHPSSHPDEATREAIQEARRYLASQTYWVPASEGHMAPDYPTLLAEGLGGTLARLDAHRQALDPLAPETPEKEAFYGAARESLEAFQGLIRRYAARAREQALEAEPAWWAEELRAAAGVCDHVAAEPPATFRQAVQLTWFLYLAVCLEAAESHHCFGPGRIDQYLYPFYARDRAAGTLDDATLEALLDQLFIKCNEFAGRHMSAVIIALGGRRPDGSDGTNELSCKLLEACDRVRMYFPGCDILWHGDMAPRFLDRCVALLANGNGQPSFFNDEVVVRGLVAKGVPFEHAVDHLPSTCTETSIAGRTNPWVAWPYVNVAKSLLYALFGGGAGFPDDEPRPDTPPPGSFAELEAAFHRQLEHDARQAVALGLRHQWGASMHRQFPLLSCFLQDCLARGRDMARGGCLYTFLQPEAVGVTNVVDGLAAARTLVEEEGRFSLDDFREAIRSNYEGHGELLRAIRRCPKHGDDVPGVNELFARVAGAWCSALEGCRSLFGGPVLPGFLGWTVWIRFGEQTPATPDGRLAGEPLAHSLAPRSGAKLRGFPAVVLSASGFDHARGLGGITFNVRFAASALAAEGGIERLRGLIEAAMELGTYQVQVDLASSQTLRDAQAHPADHEDLLVRIGGYLVPFTLLPRKAQDDVIARAELEL